MASVNKVILLGNLGSDPEVRYTASGTAVGNFRMATNENWTDKDGQRQTRTEWHRVVLWGRQAELAGEYLRKGRSVYIEGRLQTRQWQDRDGNTKYTTEIVAGVMQFVGGRDDNAGGGGSGGYGGGSGGYGGGSQNNMGGSSSAENSGPNFDYGPPPMTDDDVPF